VKEGGFGGGDGQKCSPLGWFASVVCYCWWEEEGEKMKEKEEERGVFIYIKGVDYYEIAIETK